MAGVLIAGLAAAIFLRTPSPPGEHGSTTRSQQGGAEGTDVISPGAARASAARPFSQTAPYGSEPGMDPSDDPAARLVAGLVAAIASADDAEAQGAELARRMEKLSESEIIAALTFLEHTSRSDAHRDLRLQLLQQLAERNPAAAAEILAASVALSGTSETVRTVAGIWARTDPEAALAWARRLPEGDERAQGLLGVAYQWVSEQPVESLRIAAELPPSRSRDELVAIAASEWGARDPSAATAWGRSIPDEWMRDQTLASIATAWAGTEPALAARLAVEEVSAGKIQNDAIVSIVQQWTALNPAEAGAWLTGFPAGELRDTSLGEFVKAWADLDLEQAGRWIGEAALTGSSRDAALAAYTTKALARSPGLAVPWASQIQNESLRLRQLEVIAENWMTSDPAAGRVWISSAPFSESVKARLLSIEAD